MPTSSGNCRLEEGRVRLRTRIVRRCASSADGNSPACSAGRAVSRLTWTTADNIRRTISWKETRSIAERDDRNTLHRIGRAQRHELLSRTCSRSATTRTRFWLCVPRRHGSTEPASGTRLLRYRYRRDKALGHAVERQTEPAVPLGSVQHNELCPVRRAVRAGLHTDGTLQTATPAHFGNFSGTLTNPRIMQIALRYEFYRTVKQRQTTPGAVLSELFFCSSSSGDYWLSTFAKKVSACGSSDCPNQNIAALRTS